MIRHTKYVCETNVSDSLYKMFKSTKLCNFENFTKIIYNLLNENTEFIK